MTCSRLRAPPSCGELARSDRLHHYRQHPAPRSTPPAFAAEPETTINNEAASARWRLRCLLKRYARNAGARNTTTAAALDSRPASSKAYALSRSKAQLPAKKWQAVTPRPMIGPSPRRAIQPYLTKPRPLSLRAGKRRFVVSVWGTVGATRWHTPGAHHQQVPERARIRRARPKEASGE